MSDLPVLTRTADEKIAQLEARVAELENALRINNREAMYGVNGEESPFLCCNSIAKTSKRVLNRTPAQSLKRHDAEVLRGFQSKLLGIIDGTENDPDERHKWYSAVCRILGLEIQNKKWEAEKGE